MNTPLKIGFIASRALHAVAQNGTAEANNTLPLNGTDVPLNSTEVLLNATEVPQNMTTNMTETNNTVTLNQTVTEEESEVKSLIDVPLDEIEEVNHYDTSQKCVEDTDCDDYPYMKCGVNEKKPGICSRPKLFPPTGLEVGGWVTFAIFKALSNIAGIGGGGVSVPMAMGFFHLETKPAIALSSFLIFVTSLSTFFLNFKSKHPEKPNMVLIDYNIVTIMMGTTLAGSHIGAMLLVVFPPLIIQVLLMITLIALFFNTLYQAITLTKKENLKIEKDKQEAKLKDEANGALQDERLQTEGLDHTQNHTVLQSEASEVNMVIDKELNNKELTQDISKLTIKKEVSELNTNLSIAKVMTCQCKARKEPQVEPADDSPVDSKGEKEQHCSEHENDCMNINDQHFELGKSEQQDKDLKKLKKIVKFEQGHMQWKKQGINVSLLLVLIFMNLSLGSKKNKSLIGLEMCSAWYWIIQAIFIVLCGVATYASINISKQEQILKEQYGNVNICSSDIKFTNRKIVVVTSVGFMGGLIAGALGLGGGVIYNPVMLNLGLPPLVSAASGLYLVTFSKVATTMVYIINGQLNLPLGLWVSFCSTIGSVLSMLLAQKIMAATGRQSLIVWILVFIFVLSIGIIPVFGVKDLRKIHDQGISLMSYHHICES